MAGGRPLKFQSIEELQKKIDEYFDSCFEEEWEQTEDGWKPVLDKDGNVKKRRVKPWTITGLAVALGSDRSTLIDYEKRNDELSHTIKNAKQKVQSFVEESLWEPKVAAGVIFNLKNNFNWSDKQEIQHSGELTNKVDLSNLTVEELKRLAKIDRDA